MATAISAEELAAIHAEFAEDVTYVGGGVDGEIISAVPSNVPAEAFMHAGDGLRTRSFEVLYSTLPDQPETGDTIIETNGDQWRVIERQDRDDVLAWVLIVEEVD